MAAKGLREIGVARPSAAVDSAAEGLQQLPSIVVIAAPEQSATGRDQPKGGCCSQGVVDDRDPVSDLHRALYAAPPSVQWMRGAPARVANDMDLLSLAGIGVSIHPCSIKWSIKWSIEWSIKRAGIRHRNSGALTVSTPAIFAHIQVREQHVLVPG